MKFASSKFIGGAIGALAVSALLAGCGTVSTGGASDSGEDGDKFRIVTVSKVEGITWFQRMSDGVDMFEEAHSDEVVAYQTGPDKGDPALQVQIVEDLIAQGVDAIIVVPNDPIGIGPSRN
jgi:simple sugar transport system substrate-binding protein